MAGRRTYQIAGHSQSPAGSLATTSTRPYLIAFFPAVVSRAERTGLMICPAVTLLRTAHLETVVRLERRWSVVVQVPSAVRLSMYLSGVSMRTQIMRRAITYPSTSCAGVMSVSSRVRVGTMWRPWASTKEFRGSAVVQSNEPALYIQLSEAVRAYRVGLLSLTQNHSPAPHGSKYWYPEWRSPRLGSDSTIPVSSTARRG
jgi:hypothetical protein